MPVSKEELDAMLNEVDHKITLEQVESGQSQQEFDQSERSKYRWSGSFPRGLWLTASDLAADFNTGITSLLGDEVQDAIASIGIGRFSSELPRMGITGAGAQTAGQAMTLAAGAGAALSSNLTRQGFQLLETEMNPSLIGRVGKDLMGTIEKFPKAFLGAEAGGGFGAGAAMAGAEEAGAPPESLPYAGLAGGMLGGVVPTVASNFTRSAMSWGLSHVSPWLDGGKTLAAVRLQRLAARPEDAARRVLASPDGITPGRASGEPNLMALEGRIMEDDPAMAADFAESLNRARMVAQEELRDMHGNLRLPGEWEKNVIEKVAAPGTAITLSSPQQMLKQAKKSFGPIYESFEGFPVRPKVELGDKDLSFEEVFKLSVQDETVLASDSERKMAEGILKDELSRIKTSNVDKDPTVDSKKLLFLRQQLRDRISDLSASRKRGSHITARILGNAEGAITRSLEQQLPPEALDSLQQIDAQHKVYRIVEQAVLTAGDKPLSAEAVGRAVRQLSPRGSEDLRKAARAGRDVASVLGDPRAARLLVQGQPVKVKKQLQSDFFHDAWERSATKEMNDNDAPLISGDRYLQHLLAHRETGKALGIPTEQYNRAIEIAKNVKMMEAKSPQALREVLEDGPHSILQLMATLIGAKSGSHLAKMGPGGGMGSSLVMSQFMSANLRRRFSTFFRTDAQQILIAATKDKELYAALLTKVNKGSQREQDKAARVLGAWSDPIIRQSFEDHDDQEEK